MFLPEIYGLELDVPRASVRVESTDAGWLGRRVVIAVDDPQAKRIELGLRNKAAFLAALDRGNATVR
jgi:hypothetical protein